VPDQWELRLHGSALVVSGRACTKRGDAGNEDVMGTSPADEEQVARACGRRRSRSREVTGTGRLLRG